MVFQGNGFFSLPAAILNFINLQGTLVPRHTYQDSAAVWFRGEICLHTRVCICVNIYIYIYINPKLEHLS